MQQQQLRIQVTDKCTAKIYFLGVYETLAEEKDAHRWDSNDAFKKAASFTEKFKERFEATPIV